MSLLNGASPTRYHLQLGELCANDLKPANEIAVLGRGWYRMGHQARDIRHMRWLVV